MNEQYNLEDTARLMTMSAGEFRRKIIIIVIAAVLAAAALAFFGIRMMNDKKYDGQIAIAEKALREGNYEQAETAYLAAVDMNKRKTRAREGLAYTYALESKFDESGNVYKELYEDTNDEKYKLAEEYVSEEELPLVDGIMPKDMWIVLASDRLPAADEAEDFLSAFITWYYLFGFFDSSDEAITDYRYDFEDPGDSYVMAFAYMYLQPEDTEWMYDGGDPKGWSDGVFQIQDKTKIDGVMTDVFHADGAVLDEAVKKLEDRGMMYSDDGSYYEFIQATGGVSFQTTVTGVWQNGSKFCIEYDAVADQNGPETINGDPNIGTFYAVMDITGNSASNGWGMYSNSSDMPEYIAETLSSDSEGNDAPQEDGRGNDPVFSQLEGVTFVFSSGAGGWGTELNVDPDGSFSGEFHDSDLGITGDDYPNGTLSRCVFSGTFSAPEKIDEYTYRFSVDELICEEEPGKEYIEDGMMINTTEPFGISLGDTVELYLPGKDGSKLPESFKDWMLGVAEESEYETKLKLYGLYIGEGGFAGRRY